MPSENDLEFDVLFEAFDRYASAKAAHDKAYNVFEGHSWGYFGHEYIQDMENTRKAAKESLRLFIRSEIKEILGEK